MRLNCIGCGTHSVHGGEGVFCHTHLNLSHSQRPGQTKPQEKAPALVQWAGAALLVWKTTGNTCGGLDIGKGWRGRGAARNQDPRAETQPDLAGSHWHFLIRYIRAKVGAVGQAEQISMLSSATGSGLGTEWGMERARGRDDWCLIHRRILSYLWHRLSVALSCLLNR